MRLAPLLAALSDEELERLAAEHVRTDERLPKPQLCNFLEGALRSYRFINDFIINRQPPTFALLTMLLDAPGYALPVHGLSERAMAETRRIADLIDAGELVSRHVMCIPLSRYDEIADDFKSAIRHRKTPQYLG